MMIRLRRLIRPIYSEMIGGGCDARFDVPTLAHAARVDESTPPCAELDAGEG
jgi:hypothetical protein